MSSMVLVVWVRKMVLIGSPRYKFVGLLGLDVGDSFV